jgi:predicted MFS family arabinose efflux permease
MLALLNLVNLAARYVIPGVQTLLQAELLLSGRAIGTLSSAFFLVFMVFAPVAGWMGDRLSRKWLLVGATLFWCAFTVFTAISKNYFTLIFNHAIFAAGEATVAIVAPAVIADFYPEGRRNLVMTFFATTVPAGTALGYALGGWLSARHGWREPLFVTAAAGVLAAGLAALFLHDPQRGASDGITTPGRRASLRGLAHNAAYISLVVASICLASSMVGIMVWLPAFFVQQNGVAIAQAGRHLGLLTLCDGVGGVIAGGLIAQRWVRSHPGALYSVSACAMVLAICFGTVLCFGPASLFYPAASAMQVCFFITTAPMAAAFLNSVDATVRASALALSLFATHALGDGISPTLIGWIADYGSLRAGIAIALSPLLIGASALWYGGRAVADLKRDQKLQAASSH